MLDVRCGGGGGGANADVGLSKVVVLPQRERRDNAACMGGASCEVAGTGVGGARWIRLPLASSVLGVCRSARESPRSEAEGLTVERWL
jgi:hypothetical protein